MRFITVTLSLFAVITTLSGCERTKQTSEKNLLKKWVEISHLKVNLELVLLLLSQFLLKSIQKLSSVKKHRNFLCMHSMASIFCLWKIMK